MVRIRKPSALPTDVTDQGETHEGAGAVGEKSTPDGS